MCRSASTFLVKCGLDLSFCISQDTLYVLIFTKRTKTDGLEAETLDLYARNNLSKWSKLNVKMRMVVYQRSEVTFSEK